LKVEELELAEKMKKMMAENTAIDKQLKELIALKQ